MEIITYIVEAGRYDGVPAELAWDGVERKAFKYPCRTPSSMFDYVVVVIIGGGGQHCRQLPKTAISYIHILH